MRLRNSLFSFVYKPKGCHHTHCCAFFKARMGAQWAHDLRSLGRRGFIVSGVRVREVLVFRGFDRFACWEEGHMSVGDLVLFLIVAIYFVLLLVLGVLSWISGWSFVGY